MQARQRIAGRAPPHRRRTGAVGLLLALACGVARPVGSEPAIAVVVGKSTSALPALSQTEVLGIYARKRQLWDDGTRIIAVNLPASHPLRRSFSTWVFKRSPEDLQSYWNDQYFHGILPPPVLASEEAVLRFVSSTSGAVGYVSVCTVDKRVEVVAVIQAPEGSAACGH